MFFILFAKSIFQVKMKNFGAARRAIGSYLAAVYKRVSPVSASCPTKVQKRMIMAGAETLYSQFRGIVGNENFARLFGLKSLSKPEINLQTGKTGSTLSMSRVGMTLTTDKPVAIFTSAGENKAKIVPLGVSNHADLNTEIMYMEVMRDAQPDTNIFIGEFKIKKKFFFIFYSKRSFFYQKIISFREINVLENNIWSPFGKLEIIIV